MQNGADAIIEDEGSAGAQEGGTGRIHVLLSGDRLYVANTGAPLSEDGLDALLQSHSSPKRANQIGRFGLGFKSLLGLSQFLHLEAKSQNQAEPLNVRVQAIHTLGALRDVLLLHRV